MDDDAVLPALAVPVVAVAVARWLIVLVVEVDSPGIVDSVEDTLSGLDRIVRKSLPGQHSNLHSMDSA